MQRTVCYTILVFSLTVYLLHGADAPKLQLHFKTEQGEKNFRKGKKEFLDKKLREAQQPLMSAQRDAADAATKQEVAKWVYGLKGLRDFLVIEQNASRKPAWAYINAQQRLIYYYNNPAGDFFRSLIQEFEKPQKFFVHKVEDFEGRGNYSAKFGRTYCHKAMHPQFVIQGERSLQWECKDRNSQAFVINKMPKDCSEYRYLGFWLYGTKGKSSKLYLYITNEAKRKAQDLQTRFDGYQAQLSPHTGWKFIVLDLQKDFSRRGTGSLKNVATFQLQLPVKKPFVTYVDSVVLFREKPKPKKTALQQPRPQR